MQSIGQVTSDVCILTLKMVLLEMLLLSLLLYLQVTWVSFGLPWDAAYFGLINPAQEEALYLIAEFLSKVKVTWSVCITDRVNSPI